MPTSLPVIDASTPLCCDALGSEQFGVDDAAQVAARLRALADANRVRIVQQLSCCDGHEITTSDAAKLLGVSDVTANHHLKQLERAGLVHARRDGARVLYGLRIDAMHALSRTLHLRCGAGCACC